MADVYSADLILPPYLIKPKLHSIGETSLDAIVGLAHEFSASLAATGIRIMRMTREPLILIAQDLAGTKWQWLCFGSEYCPFRRPTLALTHF